ncbi:cation:proton antiporter [Opitutaceae bacterium TAV4]|nr:cation:proton antiporter [Opitutaceae bacterium TAV4]RRK01837.1 cation:proton antiporter [Opitutaceae bacterium TAV3]
MNCIVLNLLIASVWLLLQERPSFPGFAVGFLIGFALIRLFRGVLDSRDYTRRVSAAAKFFWIFQTEFLLACAQLMRIVLFTPARKLRPRVITYDISGLTRLETLFLTHCITLTPGSSVLAFADDMKTLVLHILDTSDPDAVRARIDNTLRRGILAITRPSTEPPSVSVPPLQHP